MLGGVCATVVEVTLGVGVWCVCAPGRRVAEKVRGIGEGGNMGKWGVCLSVCSGKVSCREEMGGEPEKKETRR